jgi:dnd system-associated protein 4
MRRIQRDSVHDETIKTITTGDFAIFKEIWRLMLFASSVGIAHGKRTPLKNVDSGKNIPESYFGAPGWPGYLHLLGITETGGSDILHYNEKNQETVISAFEEYANAGLEIIGEKIRQASTPLDALSLILMESQQKDTAAPAIEELI